LFFVGLPWLHTAKSGLIFGVSEDARYIADRIAARRDESEYRRALALVAQAHTPTRAKSSRVTTRWADHAMALSWASALSLMLDGFATYATGIYPTAQHNPPYQADSAVVSADATQSWE
jgi:putative flavoprotein involved in K+ transport